MVLMMRKCFLTDEYVFYAEERAKRPHSFKKVNVKHTPKEDCPFCVENEYMTPKRVFATEDNEIRIVPNRYPYFTPNTDFFGIHDVVIDTPDHEEKLSMFTKEHIARLLKVIRKRVHDIAQDDRIKFVQVFKNQGINAGASQSHSHWQITGLPVIPNKHKEMLARLNKFKADNGVCYFCQLDFEDRIVEENEDIVAFCPYDARFSFEMNIMPKRHLHNFTLMTDKEIDSLAEVLKKCLMRLCKVFDGISYNICFYSAPLDEENCENMHFFIQIIPRIGQMAGFEFSMGSYISSTFPEKAAKMLREVDIDF